MLHLVQAMLSINVAVLIYKLQVWMQKIVVRHVALLLKIKSAAKNNAIRHDVPNHALQVNCNVFTCVHYSDGLCEADSICVDSENQETKDKNQTLCETFRKKRLWLPCIITIKKYPCQLLTDRDIAIIISFLLFDVN